MAASPLVPEGLPTLELPVQRRDTLSDLRSSVRRQGMQLALVRGGRAYFEDLVSRSLEDQDWEVRLEAALFIREAVPLLAPADLEFCVIPTLPGLIRNLGHEVMTLRRACLHALQVYLSLTKSPKTFLDVFVREGLRSDGHLVRRGCVVSVRSLFAEGRGGVVPADQDVFPVFETLVDLLLSELYSSSYPVLAAIDSIRQMSGPVTFSAYVERLNPALKKVYQDVLGNYSGGSLRQPTVSRTIASDSWNSWEYLEVVSTDVQGERGKDRQTEKLHCGIMDFRTAKGLRNEDWRVRAASVEHVKCLLKNSEKVHSLVPHLDSFLELLTKLLDDCHPKVVSLALDVLGALVDQLEVRVLRISLRMLVNAASKRLGDTKIVIREQCARVLHRLMRRTAPGPVLSLLVDRRYQGCRNPRLREEIVNRVTAAVLTFPSSDLDLGALCRSVSPALVDPRRRVRLAAMECFAALAQALGPNRIHLVVAAVDYAELNYEGGEGLWAALQTRLSRRTLPSCSPAGMVTYALSLPASGAVGKRSGSPSGLDVEWVVAASGSTSSATPPSRRPRETAPVEVQSSRRGSRPRTGYLVSMGRPRPQRRGATRQCSVKPSKSPSSTRRDTSVQAGSTGSRSKQGSERCVDGCGCPSEGTDPRDVHDKPNDDVEYPFANNQDPIVVRHNALKPERIGTGTASTETTCLTTDTLPESVPNGEYPNGGEETASQARTPLRRRSSLRLSSSRASKELPWLSGQSLDTSSAQDEPEQREEHAFDDSGRDDEVDADQPCVELLELANHSGTENSSVNPEKTFGNKPLLPGRRFDSSNSSAPATPSMGNGSVVGHPAGCNSVEVSQHSSAQASVRSAGGGHKASAVLATLEDCRWGALHESPTRGRWRRSPSLPVGGQLHEESNNFLISKITMGSLLRRKEEVLREVEQKRILELAKIQRQQSYERDRQESRDWDAEESGSTSDVSHVAPQEHQGDGDSVSVESIRSSAEAVACSISSRSRSSSLKAARGKDKQGTAHPKSSSITTLPNPTAKPTETIRRAFKNFASESWKVKVEAMQVLQDVAAQHPEAFTPPVLKTALRLLTEEVRNLRSSVARAAIAALAGFFQHLRKNMEPELETVVQALLHKSGENASFIREDVDCALSVMVDHVTPTKALHALIEAGASHRNGAVRRTAAQCVLTCVEKLGPSRCLQQNREVAEKLLPATAHFVMDAAPLTRYYGRKVFHLLLNHPEFQRQFERYVVPTTRRNVASILEGIARKGAGEMPKECPTASRRSRASKGGVF